MTTKLEDFKKLSPDAKLKQLQGELVGAFPANSITYDLNEILAEYPNYEVFVWNAAMNLVEKGVLDVIQVKFGQQVRWLMTITGRNAILANTKFYCPLAKN